MAYHSGSGREERPREDRDAAPETIDAGEKSEVCALRWYESERIWNNAETLLPAVAKTALSSQVMEYYRKYSQNSSLGSYFSLPESASFGRTYHSLAHPRASEPDRVSPSCAVSGAIDELARDRAMPRERRRWVRPPLVGQPSLDGGASRAYVGPESRTPSPVNKRTVDETIPEENDGREPPTEGWDNETTKISVSPASSVASHKPLEWDSGADVGYFNSLPPSRIEDEKLSSAERVARGGSVAMRLDPEGINESVASSASTVKTFVRPIGNSTPISHSGGNEMETPVGRTMPRKNESSTPADEAKNEESAVAAAAIRTEYPAQDHPISEETRSHPSLTKSTSMNVLAVPLSKLSLKRSQSELNLRAKGKSALPLIFDSTSSIATIVDKATTRDKLVQTSLDGSRESVGIQVEVATRGESETPDRGGSGDSIGAWEKRDEGDEAEGKPPERAGSSIAKSLHSILKKANAREPSPARERNSDERTRDDEEDTGGSMVRNGTREGRTERSDSSERSRNGSSVTRSEILVEETSEENATGRTSDSFEYFPGNACRNVPIGTSRVSSSEGRESTMPNTSSSIDEKLWGDSDSLVRDLERSVNILKSLVDAKKCDKQVKKRLIHHVIKRLVTAKYTDDRIERDLEENVPWNPADARNKVYRNDIIQALASNEQRPTTDTSTAEEWTPRKRNSACPRKNLVRDARALEEMIDLATSDREIGATNGDEILFDGHTDRTLMDGRRARMGLRSEERERCSDGERSSECFVPQSHSPRKNKSTNVFYSIEKTRESVKNNIARKGTSLPAAALTTAGTEGMTASTTGATSTSDSRRNLISDGIVLVKERRRNETDGTDWRLPTTMSERRFELGRFGNSVSGDARLINYAEMERRNQLVWITNEISHLCNLKRLLEEPGDKVEGGSRAGDSPKKRFSGSTIGQWIAQTRNGRNLSSRSERARGPGSGAAAADESLERVLENQWSSHGNLASSERPRRSTRDEDRAGVEHTRKRNSCTQTGSDGGPSGHSATGGEIVSALPALPAAVRPARDRGATPPMRDAYVQTRFANGEKISKPARSQDTAGTSTKIVASSNGCEKTCATREHHVCYCQRYAAHSRHRACVIHSPQRSTPRRHTGDCLRRTKLDVTDERRIITHTTFGQSGSSTERVDSRKDAKNQLNATCRSNYAIRALPGRADGHCATCNREKISMLPKDSETFPENESIGVRSIDCDCEVSESDESRVDRRKKDASPRNDKKTSTEGEIRDESSSSDRGCACNFENRARLDDRLHGGAVDRRNSRKNPPTIKVNGVEKTWKSCRTCGTIWPVANGKNANRKCKCSQDYLKPVAYELNFDKTVTEKQRRVGGKKPSKSEKVSDADTSTKTKRQSRTTRTASIVENPPEKCVCKEDEENVVDKDEKRAENDRPDTLKDFLATNKPEFLKNIETRRRYMSELSQLRQLKREKRKQFLAVAGASAFLRSQRSAKGSTATVQRKLSEHEMKIRLRTRYLCLNEVRNKKRQREKEEDARRNHLMAKLFGQKLQQKVLKGQVDLSQSVSVISNL